MLLDKEVLIKNNGRIRKHYENLGLDVSKEFIAVPIDLVTKGSHVKVSCSCDICGDTKNMMYKTYVIHTKYDGLYYCLKCSSKKRENIMLDKYGHKSYTQTDEFKLKSKKTCLKKYGHEFYQSSNNYKDKIVKTCLDKYGTTNVMQVSEFFERQGSSSYKFNKYNDLTYQGTYELDFIEKYYDRVTIKKIDPIEYELDGKLHYYHSDFYLPEYNLIVEIKSSYTYEYELNKNLSKKEYSIKNGYNFLFVIDKNYDDLENIIFNT